MPIGTKILAARDGQVNKVVNENEAIIFADIERHQGIPRTSFFYTSENSQN